MGRNLFPVFTLCILGASVLSWAVFCWGKMKFNRSVSLYPFFLLMFLKRNHARHTGNQLVQGIGTDEDQLISYYPGFCHAHYLNLNFLYIGIFRQMLFQFFRMKIIEAGKLLGKAFPFRYFLPFSRPLFYLLYLGPFNSSWAISCWGKMRSYSTSLPRFI